MSEASNRRKEPFDVDRARRLAVSTQDIGKMARRLEDACDEIVELRETLLKSRNYAQSAAHIANRALDES